MFRDHTGKVSSKRIMGAVLIVAAIVANYLGAGDPATNQVMIWSGIAAIGVGTLETRVQK